MTPILPKKHISSRLLTICARLLICLPVLPLFGQTPVKATASVTMPGPLPSSNSDRAPLMFPGLVLNDQGQPISHATVRLENPTDSTVLAATQTADNGFFTINGSSSSVLLHISHIGYQDLSKRVTLQASREGINIPDTFRLQTAPQLLPEVKITGNKAFMTLEGDKKIFSVDRMGGVAAGTAGDVMQSIPLVNVDQEGNVSLRSKAANVLVNGKPSPYSDIATTLEMIQAGNIDKVEVITNPSARYDAEGPGGIINIVLKKNTDLGYHGVVNLDVATLPDEHAGTDFNYRNQHLHVFGNINYHTRAITGRQTVNQYFGPADSAYQLTQDVQTRLRNNDADARLGIEITLNDQTTLSITQAFADHNLQRGNIGTVDSGASGKPNYLLATHQINSQTRNQNYNISADLLHHFRRAGEQLTASLSWSDNSIHTSTQFNNTADGHPTGEISSGRGAPQLWTGQADYSLPIGKTLLEAGYKWQYRSGGNDVFALVTDSSNSGPPISASTGMPVYVYSPAMSSLFSEKSLIQAIYVTGSGQLKTLHYILGLRAEYSTENGRSELPAAAIRRQFFNLFPSLHLSKDLSNGQSISFAYASRITRPGFEQLLPYVNNTNPLNYVSGNPALSPALTSNFEVGYTQSFTNTGNFLNLSFYYSNTRNSIQPITQKDSSGVPLTQPQNIGSARQAGADLIYRLQLWQKIHFTTTLDGNYTRFPQQAGYWAGSLKLTADAILPQKFTLLIRGELTTPQPLPQGHSNNIKGIDLELRRPFWHNRLTAALLISDALNDRKENSEIQTPLFLQYERYKESTRMLHLHLSYHF